MFGGSSFLSPTAPAAPELPAGSCRPPATYAYTPPPKATTATSASTTPAINLSLLRNMAFITPSVRTTTLIETTPVTAPWAATSVAVLIVEETTEAGTLADTAFCASRVANDPA